AARAALAAA
nr:Chain U, unknown [Homo sapiens]